AVACECREKILERRLLENWVAAGEQETVPLPVGKRVAYRLRFVDADADRLDLAAGAKRVERLIGALHAPPEHRGLRIPAAGEAVDVVDDEDVDPAHAEALNAVLVGAHDAIIGVVERGLERKWLVPLVGGVLGAEPPAHLGREHDVA